MGSKDSCLKGYKVLTLSGQRAGVAASSFASFLKKCCKKFQLSEKGASLCLPDGTLIDADFFGTLENQSTLVLLRSDENLHCSSMVALVSALLSSWRGEELRAGVEALIKRLGLKDLTPPTTAQEHDRSALSTRAQDPDWFQDLETGARTKELFMRRRCAARVRTFFYRSRQQLRERCPAGDARRTLESTLRLIADELRRNDGHGGYFDRGAPAAERLCSAAGQFRCDGDVSAPDGCRYVELHAANPYSSREARIQFSTWNLDHRIERSRTVLPALLTALGRSDSPHPLNWHYFYRLLFTRHNLGLVHVVCHDKSVHATRQCDPKQFFKPGKRSLNIDLTDT